MIGQGNGPLYVYACKRVASVDKLMYGCAGSKPKIDGGVILLHSVFLIWIDKWKNNFNKFAPKEREGGCLLYTSPSPRDLSKSRMPSSA